MRNKLEIKDCIPLGAGHEGAVYLTPDGRALKVFKKVSSAKAEENILIKTEDSRFFPKVIYRDKNKLLREFVEGKNLYEYIEENGLSYKLSTEIIDLIEDFKRLKFKRINIRNAHIFVDKEENIKVIDPRKPFNMKTPYPKNIIRILVNLDSFEEFLKNLSLYKPNLLDFWIEGFQYAASVRDLVYNKTLRRYRFKKI